MLPQLFDALEFAAVQHQYQRRSGYSRLPYINHLIKVAHLLLRVEGEQELAVLQAALLHDILEDTEVTPAVLTARFGERVCRIVEELTDDMSLPYPVRKRLQIERAPALSPGASKIKIADKSANLRDIVDYPLNWNKARKLDYLHWAVQVVDRLRGRHPKLEAHFDATVAYARQKLQAEAE